MKTLTDLIESLRIKSIQRGIVNASGDVTVTISDINSNKAYVILNNRVSFTTGGTSSRTVSNGVYLLELTDNSLKLAQSNGGGILPNYRILLRYSMKVGVLND